MKKIVVFILAFVSVSLSYGQITSTATGGKWSSPSTWVGGVVPTKENDVVIKGTVIHSAENDACRNLLVKKGGVLTTLSPHMNGYVVKVYGNLTNNGTIENNKAGNWLQLFVYKNITNNGKWTNYGVSLMGNADQTISGTKPFSPYFILMQNANSLIAGSNVDFQGVTLLFYKKNKFMIGEGKMVTFSYSSLHKKSTPFMPPDNSAQSVHFTGKGKVLVDGKYKLGNCVFDGVKLIK